MRKSVLVVLGLVLITGCSSSLKVYDASNQEAKGIPINAPQLVEIMTKTSYKVAEAEGSEKYKHLCTTEENSTLEFLPLGDRYYVTFDPSHFGDGEFSVEFNDKGLLKSVTLNSKPSAGTEQATALLSSVLPFVATPKLAKEEKSVIGEEDTAQKLKEKHCLKVATKVIGIKKVDSQ